jgi:ankyrin repeat protein
MKYIKNFEAKNYLDDYEADDLIETISNGNFEKLSLLLDKYKNRNVNINFDYNGGFTPLDYAILHHVGLKILKLLVDYGANINRQNPSGVTPLMFAASRVKMDYFNFDIVVFLIKAGADWNIIDSHNMDFLDYLPEDKERQIISKFRVEYENYLITKQSNKYNL